MFNFIIKFATVLLFFSVVSVASDAGYNEPCDPSTPCDRFASLTCSTDDPSGGICLCSEPTFMIYDEGRTKCVSLVGVQGNCYRRPVNDIERLCVDQADCVRRPEDVTNDSPFGFCKCAVGFVRNEDRTCDVSALEYGEECDDRESDGATKTCEHRSGLTCSLTEQICRCVAPDFMVWNVEERQCLSLADDGGNCFLEPVGGIERPCVENAQCWPRPGSSPFGYCSCVLNYFKYADRTCGLIQSEQSFGQPCNATHYCDVAASLLCAGDEPEETCACVDSENMIFDRETRICRSLVNGPDSSCYTQPIGGVQRLCVTNAICVPQTDNPLMGTCSCDAESGFVTLADRTCGPRKFNQGYSQGCNATHTCDRAAILDCDNENGVCTCVENSGMIYEQSSQACVSLVGPEFNCFLQPIADVQRKCVQNAGCLPRPGAPDSPIGFCSCTEGFVPNSDKTCGLPKLDQKFGETCNATWSCIPEALLSCGSASVCGCAYAEDSYDEARKKCLSPIGGLCHVVVNGQGLKRDCLPLATCEAVKEGLPYGFCQCVEGYIPGAGGRCVPAATPNPGLIGDACKVNDPQTCSLDNAICELDGSGKETCKCKEGFSPAADKTTCVKGNSASQLQLPLAAALFIFLQQFILALRQFEF